VAFRPAFAGRPVEQVGVVMLDTKPRAEDDDRRGRDAELDDCRAARRVQGSRAESAAAGRLSQPSVGRSAPVPTIGNSPRGCDLGDRAGCGRARPRDSGRRRAQLQREWTAEPPALLRLLLGHFRRHGAWRHARCRSAV
jgi:hypothetical protein